MRSLEGRPQPSKHPQEIVKSHQPSARSWFNELLSSLFQNPSFPCSGEKVTPPYPLHWAQEGEGRRVRASKMAQAVSKR
eukprot:3240945-Pyramimonas_sp.AAC.1